MPRTSSAGNVTSGYDLRYADLSRGNLSGASLSNANLSRANIARGDLSGASLGHANLSRANLTGARLSGASLGGVNFSYANLAGVDLSGQSLGGNNLYGANLSGANLSGASLGGADLRCANSSGANLAGASLGGARRGCSPGRRPPSPLPKLLAGSFSGIRPRDVDFSADAGNIVTNIRWQHWNHTSGVGHGTSNILSCIPDCADGKATPVATSVTFSKPVRGHFTKVVEVRAGQTLVGHYPRPWPVEGARAASAAASCGKLRIVRRSANYGVTAMRIRARHVTCRAAQALIVRVVDASRNYLNAPRFFHDVTVARYRCHYVRAGFDVGTESCRSGRRGVLWQEQHGRLSQGY